MFGKRPASQLPKPVGKKVKLFSSGIVPILPNSAPAVKATGLPGSNKNKSKKLFAHSTKKNAQTIEYENAQALEKLLLQQLSPEELQNRKDAFNQVKTDISNDTSLPLRERLGPSCKWVISKGPINANLMVIGEGPGETEAKTGIPFVGDSGQELSKMLLEQGIKSETHVFTMNLVFIRTDEKNRDPLWEEVKAYSKYVKRIMAIVRPKQILCVGRLSSALLSKGFDGLDSLRGSMRNDGRHSFLGSNMEQMYKNSANNTAIVIKSERFVSRVYCTYHPAFLLRQRHDCPNEKRFDERWAADFLEVRRLLDEAPFQFIDAEEIVKQTEEPGFVYTVPGQVCYPKANPLSIQDAKDYAAGGLEFEMHRVEYSEKKNVYHVLGRTADDHSVALCVANPVFSFYVSHPSLKYEKITEANVKELEEQACEKLIKEITDKAQFAQLNGVEVRLSLERRRKYIDISREKVMLKVEYFNSNYRRQVVNIIDQLIGTYYPDWRPPKPQPHRSFKPPGVNYVKTYEASRTPMQQMLRTLNIYVRGWIQIPAQSACSLRPKTNPEHRVTTADLEYDVQYHDLKGYSPNPDEAGDAKWERQAPTRKLALDAEMLNTAGKFPRHEQDPIISICAYADTSDRADKKNYGERIRSSVAGKSSEIRLTGRSNYDDAVAFCVGSLAKIHTTQFKPIHLPNVPQPPKQFSSGWYDGGRDPKTKGYTKNYGIDIRVWNDFIEKYKVWQELVGIRRAKWIINNQELYENLQELKVRPGGKDVKAEWKDEADILQWERRVQFVIRTWESVKKKDVANLKTPKSWDDELKTLSQEDAERELGVVQSRWHMFRPEVRAHSFKDESDMMRGFYNYVNSYDPDIITGYNSNNFDLAYFINRVQVLNLRTPDNLEFISMGRMRGQSDKDILKQSFSRATGERSYHTPQVPGRDCYDLMNYVMRECKLSSFSLATVSEFYLKDTKNDVPYSAIPSLFRTNRERLNSYCAKDAELVLMLMNDMNNMNYLIGLSRLLGKLHIERLYVDGKQEQVFSVLLRFLVEEKLNKVMPDRNIYSHENEDDAEIIEGAHVFDPKLRGLYEKLLLCLDFNALYPTIMLGWNLGHDVSGTAARMAKYGIDLKDCFKTLRTFRNPKTGVQEHWYFLQPRKLTKEQAIAAGFKADATDCNITPGKDAFYIFENEAKERFRCAEKDLQAKGLNPDNAYMYILPVKAIYSPKIDDAAVCAVLKKILAARKRVNVKKETFHPASDEYRRLNMVQMAYKIVANSTYGATGVKMGKLAGPHIAASVTGKGKMIILALAKRMEEQFDADVQGGDTDSIFVHFPDIDTLDKIFEVIKVTNPETGEVYETTRIKEKLDVANSMVPAPMKIDFEKAFEKMFALAKKRAVTLTQTPIWDSTLLEMVFKQAKLEYKGVEMKRRDSCKVAQATLTGFAERIFLGAGTKEDRELAAANYVAGAVYKVLCGDVRFHELIQSRQLSKKKYETQTPHVVLSEKMQKRGYRPRELGERVNFIVVTGRKTRTFSESVEDPDYAMEHDLAPDYHYIVEKKIQTPVERFTACMPNGEKYNKIMFGRNIKRQRENLLDDDPMFKHVRSCIPCMVCGAPNLTAVCQECKPTADWRKLLQEERAKLDSDQTGYDKAMKHCRGCTGVGPEEGIDCDNGNCSEYFPRRRGEYDIKKRNNTIQVLQDMETLY
jgi:uracil-DNA glycosylase family 4